MKHAPLIILCFFLILPSCKKQTTTPEPPKPKATISLDVTDEGDLVFYYNGYGGYWYAVFWVIVSENNGVSGTVTNCKLKFTKNNTHVSEATYPGGSFSANGTCTILCSPTVYGIQFPFDKMEISVTGADNNGYSFSKSKSYVWGSD